MKPLLFPTTRQFEFTLLSSGVKRLAIVEPVRCLGCTGMGKLEVSAIMMNISDYVMKFMKAESFSETDLIDEDAVINNITCVICQKEIPMFSVLDHIVSLEHQITYQKSCSPYEYNDFVICINQYRGTIQYPMYFEAVKEEYISNEDFLISEDHIELTEAQITNENEETQICESTDMNINDFEHKESENENLPFETIFQNHDICIREYQKLGDNYNQIFEENEETLDGNANEYSSEVVPDYNSNKMLADNVKEMLADNVKEMLAGNVKEMLAGNVKEMLAGNVKEMLAGNVKEIFADNVKEMLADNVNKMLADDVNDILADNINEILADNINEILADNINEMLPFNVNEILAEALTDNVNEILADNFNEILADNVNEMLADNIDEMLADTVNEMLTDYNNSMSNQYSVNEQEFQDIIHQIESKQWSKIQLADIANAAISRLTH